MLSRFFSLYWYEYFIKIMNSWRTNVKVSGLKLFIPWINSRLLEWSGSGKIWTKQLVCLVDLFFSLYWDEYFIKSMNSRRTNFNVFSPKLFIPWIYSRLLEWTGSGQIWTKQLVCLADLFLVYIDTSTSLKVWTAEGPMSKFLAWNCSDNIVYIKSYKKQVLNTHQP